MKITPNQRFRHDGQTYEEGQEYDVPDGLGQYFENVGWVGSDKEKANRNHSMRAADLGLPITEPKQAEMLVSELETLIGKLRTRTESEVKLG
jgi:hypothetical protein